MRRTSALTTIAALSALSIVIAGCSTATPASTGEIEGEVTYSFWGTPERAAKVEDVISLFEAANPDATVRSEVADYFAYTERLTVRAAGNDLPCVSGMQSTFFAQYAQADVLLPLDDLIEEGAISTDGIPEDVMAAGQIDGIQYMIPTGSFVRLFAYNEELVKAAGVTEPGDDMTWEEWADWLHELQAGLPDGVYAAENDGGFMFTFVSWVVGHGEQMFVDGELGFSKDILRDYFQYWIDLAEAGVALPPADIPLQTDSVELRPLSTGYAATGARDLPTMYLTEVALADAGTPSAIVSVSTPSQSPDVSANVLGANGISIPQSCDNVATAAAFTDFFANDLEAAVAFQSDNGVLTNVDAQDALLEDPAASEGAKRSIELLRGLTDSGDLTTSTYPEGYGSITAELQRLYEAAAFGQITVDQAVDEFFTAAENALN
jgi:multiple sugar transport system substrate-binding protein